MEEIQAKTILSNLKNAPDPWFGISYSMNLYRGCQHQCIYCDSRSACYQIDDFSKIQIKSNALELLEWELKRKKVKATIGTGSMNDPYMPIEKETQITRKALQIINRFRFPVHVITKSSLVLRDIDLLKKASETYAAVSITITTDDDNLARKIEPAATLSSGRYETIRQLSEAGIYCGVLIMPVLPFITDSVENIAAIIEKAAKAGAKYLLMSPGVTLRDRQRDYFYQQLQNYFPTLPAKYKARYGESYMASVPEALVLQNYFQHTCKKLGIETSIQFYKTPEDLQLSFF